MTSNLWSLFELGRHVSFGTTHVRFGTIYVRRKTDEVLTLDPAQVLEPDGYYLFLGEPPPASNAWAIHLIRALDLDFGALIWAATAETLPSQVQVLRFNRRCRVPSKTLLRIEDLELSFSAGARIEVDRAELSFVMTARSEPLQVNGQDIDRLRIPFGDSSVAGSLHFDARLAPDPSVRFFYGGGTALKRFEYPVLADGQSSLGRYGVVRHPSRPFDPAVNTVQPQGAVEYATGFRTTLGRSITLENAGGQYITQYDPVGQSAYQVLDGPWKLGVTGSVGGLTGATGPEEINLMFGLSGVETGKVVDGWLANFSSAGAYAPHFGSGAANSAELTDTIPGVTNPVKTAWMALTAPGGGPTGPMALGSTGPLPSGYYTQPVNSAFYERDASDPEVLSFLQIRTVPFTTVDAYPVAPYGEVAAGPSSPALDDYRNFELQVLSKVRRDTLLPTFAPRAGGAGPLGVVPCGGNTPGATGVTGATCIPSGHGATGPTGPPPPQRLAATPRGLLAGFDGDLTHWQELTLASTDRGAQRLQITDIQDDLRAALLDNQLFLVIDDGCKFLEACSIPFELTLESFRHLAAEGVPSTVLASTGYLRGIRYGGLGYFDAVLQDALGTCYSQYKFQFYRAAAFAKLEISGWTFDLSPYLWTATTGSMLVFKFAEAPLETLAADLSRWTAAGQFTRGSAAETQTALLAFIKEARERSKTDPDYTFFVETVLANRQPGGGEERWNGVLCLNCTVPLTELPPQLAGLAAGIDPAKFRGHHFGISASSIRYQNQQLSILDTSLFGLIDYQDPGDLSYEGQPYDFKVKTLKVLFANTTITNFASIIELLVGELFNERSNLPPGSPNGDNIVLNGVWQRHGDVDSYFFTEQGESRFYIQSAVLESVEINRSQFVTELPKPGGSTRVETRFLFWGALRFQALQGFDLFSFGPDASGQDGKLQFSNLSVEMSFDPYATPVEKEFRFNAGNLAFDLATSQARPSSLYRRFPLGLTRLIQGKEGVSPASLGYIPVRSPLGTSSISAPWYGMVLDLKLGSPGALAAKAGFNATLLLAWAPDPATYRVAVGIQLPGAAGGKKEISIEGPLKLTMADILFEVIDADEPGNEAYMLRFYNIALSFLGVSFPPGGSANVLLFGDPDPQSKASSLGWYAAYAKDPKDEGGDNLGSFEKLSTPTLPTGDSQE